MNEREWLECTDTKRLLSFVAGLVTERKLRLYACACARRVRHLLADPCLDQIVNLSERYSDGQVTRVELLPATDAAAERWFMFRAAAAEAAWATSWARSFTRAADAAARAAGAAEAAASVAVEPGGPVPWLRARTAETSADQAERQRQCDLLRDIVGNPFRPIRLDRAWRQGRGQAAVQLAEAIYRERRFAEVPRLAGALRAAGDAAPALLEHCQAEDAEHTLGCWLVDVLLDKHD